MPSTLHRGLTPASSCASCMSDRSSRRCASAAPEAPLDGDTSAIADWRASLEGIYPASAVFRVLAAAHSILDAGWADVMCRPALGLSSPYGEQYAGIIAFVVLLFSWQWILYEFVSWRPELLDLVQPCALDSEGRKIAERVFMALLARFTSEAPQTRF